jgi:hypothetical protein
MSIHQTAYDTTAGSAYPVSKISHALLEALIRGMGYNDMGLSIGPSLSLRAVTGIEAHEASIPVFAHPLLVEKGSDKYLFVDIRSSVGINRSSHELIIKNTAEYDFMRYRAGLNLIWLTEEPSVLRDISFVPSAVYASWLSETISRRFNLDPKEQMQIAILAAAFYYNLHRNKGALHDDVRIRMEACAVRAVRAPHDLIQATINQVDKFEDIRDLCETIRLVLDNPRLNDLNPALLIGLLGGSWYGNNSREILNVALEHPPTWIAITHAALTNKTYRRAGISSIAERYTRNKGGDNFIKGLVTLMQDRVTAGN